MRAPEVFLGQSCTGTSQVWAVAAMILCWIKPGILGVADSPSPIINEAWCMAKLLRLFPRWEFPSPDEFERPSLKASVKSASRIKEMEEMQHISSLEEEMTKLEIPQELRDLLRLMLVTDPSKRPSASFVLASAEFRALEKIVGI